MITARPDRPTALARPARPAIRILHLEDSDGDSAVVRRYLDRQGFGGHVVRASTRADFLDHLTHDLDLVLADHSMPGFDSCEALRLVRDHCPDLPFIIVSGTITEAAAVESIKSGAADYIWKDRLQRLGPAIEAALREREHQAKHEAALRARRESEALADAVLASLSQLICVIGPDGVIVRTNAAWKSAGAMRGDVGLVGLDVGTDYLAVCRRAIERGDETARKAFDGITAVLAGEQDAFTAEYICDEPDGRAWYSLSVTPLGRGLGAVLSHQSITELRGSEERLAQNQIRLKAIYESSLDAMFLADDAGRYVDVNPAACALLGYSREEFLRLSERDIWPLEMRRDFDQQWAALRALGSRAGEFTFQRKDGSAVEAEQRATFNVLPGLHLSIFRDITERRAAEAALRDSEEQYRLLADTATDVILTIDASSTIRYANRVVEAVFGYAPAELIGTPLATLMPAGLRPQHHAGVDRYVRTGKRTLPWGQVDARGLRKDGSEIQLAISFGEYTVGGERLFTGIIRDTTAQRKTQEALRQSEEQFVQIADAMPQLVWTTDPTGYHDYFNERWYVYTGMARPTEPGGAVREFDWNDFLHPDDVEQTFTRWSHSLATGEPYETEYRFRRAADGEYRWFIGRAMPVRDETGAVVRWFGTCTDIHDLREAEEEVRTSDERLQLVSRATNDAVWDWDVLTGTAIMNDAFTDVFGWQATEEEAFTIVWMLERVHPDERERVTASAFAAFKGGGPGWRAEYRFERADGTWADVVTQGYIVRSPDGWAVRVVGTMLDLTARKATERALVAAKEAAVAAQEAAEEVARAKSSLLMNMSHEIRTPLTAVIGYAEMLAHEAPPDLLDLVEPIERGGKRLLETLNSVLDLAQIEAGALALAAVPVDLCVEADAAVAALGPLAQAKGLALVFTGSPTPALADRPALARVLTNLVGNAIKFTERGTVAVGVWAEGARACLRVSDTGVGIDAEFLPRVFDDFEQESSGANRSHEGSGLGLTITRGLVTMMGGEITVESEKGVGSTFTVWLPAG